MPLPAAKGALPPRAIRVYVAPLQVRNNEQPMLELPPALDVPPDALNLKLAQFGNPLVDVGPLSNGRGRGGSIGEGQDGGVGNTRGNSYGPGFQGVRSLGGGVTAPRVLVKIEPEYSEEARKARYQGSVMLRVIVDEHGAVRHIEVSRPLGLGLDEKAVDAVRKWRFQPGRQDGKPVPVWAMVEVFFRLL
jgi:TonB family protein